MQSGTTLENWLDAQNADGDELSVLLSLSHAFVQIASAVRMAPMLGHLGEAGSVNVQGEDQKTLDVITHDIMVRALSGCPHVRAMVSEEEEQVIQNIRAHKDAYLTACFDPLDGSSNIETNITIGTVFSLLDIGAGDGPVTEAEILEGAARQKVAGYVLYGPATLLVLTLGSNVAMFVHDMAAGAFELVEDEIKIPEAASEFAINVAHRRHWQAPVAAYVDECLEGEQGPRGKPFNMRWAGSMVADVHRLFVRGGIFIYPALDTPGGAEGKLRLLYEANPMAMLVEAAGGSALSGAEPFHGVTPTSLHQRVPLALGSRQEVERLASKYADE